VLDLVATVRLEKEVKTTKLTNHCASSHSQKVALKHKYFDALAYVLPKMSQPGGREGESAEVMCDIKVNRKLQRKTERWSEICRGLVTTEIHDRESGERLDSENVRPYSVDIRGGHVRYSQELVSCDRLTTAHYRNSSVKLVIQIQLFVVSNFTFSCQEDGDDKDAFIIVACVP
jgi:hypothetical protein